MRNAGFLTVFKMDVADNDHMAQTYRNRAVENKVRKDVLFCFRLPAGGKKVRNNPAKAQNVFLREAFALYGCFLTVRIFAG